MKADTESQILQYCIQCYTLNCNVVSGDQNQLAGLGLFETPCSCVFSPASSHRPKICMLSEFGILNRPNARICVCMTVSFSLCEPYYGPVTCPRCHYNLFSQTNQVVVNHIFLWYQITQSIKFCSKNY